jgi:1-aminocyclopropane-1-carboxylate deaminase/D-cysteine desulfhydrase-like pyridoxal-dependent ACC family enzyme
MPWVATSLRLSRTLGTLASVRMANIDGSAVHKVVYKGTYPVYIKRDDLYSIVPGVNGNKARKFESLCELLSLKKSHSDPVILASYGGIQSNSMHALGLLAAHKSCRLVYFVRRGSIPSYLKKSPSGNYKKALECGVEVVEVDTADYERLEHAPKSSQHFTATDAFQSVVNIYVGGADASRLWWVPQGGSFPLASRGSRRLAGELWDFVGSQWNTNKLPWKVSCLLAGIAALCSKEPDLNLAFA